MDNNSNAVRVIGQQEYMPTVKETIENMRIVQQVMQSVMKEGTHYGVIPGCKQPSLYKSGSEALLSTFHIAVDPIVEEFMSSDARGRVIEVRYRVKCIGRHIGTGREVGFGVGECSTGEDKYAWRRAICEEEYDDTDETLRRVKYSKYNGKVQKTQQIRVNPADMTNTVLKMAKKRAQIDLTLTALGCSDIFSQDLEDLEDNLRENFSQEPASDPALRVKWETLANAAETSETLQEVWTAGLAECKAAGDVEACKALRTIVAKRGPELKAKEGGVNGADDPV